MASYIDSVLIKDEAVIYRGNLSLWPQALMILLGIVLLPVVAGLFILLWVYITYKATELAITNKRIIAKFGFIRRETVEINLTKVESIRVDQSILGRLLNYGTIVVSGTGSHNAPVPNISNPLEFRKKFMEATDALQTPENSPG